jgi:hypothetical protein
MGHFDNVKIGILAEKNGHCVEEFSVKNKKVINNRTE